MNCLPLAGLQVTLTASNTWLCLGDSCQALAQSLKNLPPANVAVELVLAQVEGLLCQEVGGRG